MPHLPFQKHSRRLEECLITPLPSRGEGWTRSAFSSINPHPRLLPIQGERIN